MKPTIESCCRLEKKLRNLLITTNESEIINDIVGTGDANEVSSASTTLTAHYKSFLIAVQHLLSG